MEGGLYRAAIGLVCLVGFGFGVAYLWLYRPSRWRSATARDSSGWVLALTLFFLWSLYRTCHALWSEVPAEPVGWGFALSSLALGLLLVGVVGYRLWRYVRIMREERIHPTEVCPRCGGVGVVSLGQVTP